MLQSVITQEHTLSMDLIQKREAALPPNQFRIKVSETVSH